MHVAKLLLRPFWGATVPPEIVFSGLVHAQGVVGWGCRAEISQYIQCAFVCVAMPHVVHLCRCVQASVWCIPIFNGFLHVLVFLHSLDQ